MVLIVDPVEETFPFEGQAVLADLEGPETLRVGDAGSFRAMYLERMATHRDALREACARRGWSFTVHRTDRPASEALLALASRIADRGSMGGAPSLASGELTHVRGPALRIFNPGRTAGDGARSPRSGCCCASPRPNRSASTSRRSS